MANEYKDPNTDIMKALSKAVDAATGETGTQYEYKNPNTDVIQKLEELTEAIATSGGGGGYNYSTTEQVVGTWVDDKTLYEKTLVINNLSSGAYRSVAHGIENLDVVFIKEGFALYTPSVTSNPTSAVLSSYNSTVTAEEFLGAISHNDFGYRCGADLNGGIAYITIRYTKSTT